MATERPPQALLEGNVLFNLDYKEQLPNNMYTTTEIAKGLNIYYCHDTSKGELDFLSKEIYIIFRLMKEKKTYSRKVCVLLLKRIQDYSTCRASSLATGVADKFIRYILSDIYLIYSCICILSSFSSLQTFGCGFKVSKHLSLIQCFSNKSRTDFKYRE